MAPLRLQAIALANDGTLGVDLIDIDPPWLLTQYVTGAANIPRPLDSRTY